MFGLRLVGRFALLVAALFAFASGALAHTRSETHSTWDVAGAQIRVTFTIPDLEARRLGTGGQPPTDAVLAAYLAPHINLHFVPPAGLHGAGLIAAALGGITIIASGPLSWGTAADYARYLPADTSSARIILWTVLGGFLPSLLLGALGVLAGTAVDMANPQTSFAAILPGWFYPIFLLVIITGATTNNVLTAYSSGLSLQSLGIEASRSVTVLFDGFAGVGLAIYALFVADFLDTLNNILALSVSLLGPSLAIYGMDIVLRGNRYSGADLHDETAQGAFWYSHGFNWVGLSALGAGAGAALLCANTKILVGPVARLLDGADMSALIGPAVAAGVYGGATWYGKLRRLGDMPPGGSCTSLLPS